MTFSGRLGRWCFHGTCTRRATFEVRAEVDGSKKTRRLCTEHAVEMLREAAASELDGIGRLLLVRREA